MNTTAPEQDSQLSELSPVVVRFSPEDKALYQLAADSDTGGNLSEWVRTACREKFQRRLRGV